MQNNSKIIVLENSKLVVCEHTTLEIGSVLLIHFKCNETLAYFYLFSIYTTLKTCLMCCWNGMDYRKEEIINIHTAEAALTGVFVPDMFAAF